MNKLIEHVKATYDEQELREIVEHGCVSGCASGLVYYRETVEFHDRFESEIWDMLYEDAECQGVTIMELIASFNGSKDVGSMTQLKNLLAWFAVEKVAFDLVGEAE